MNAAICGSFKELPVNKTAENKSSHTLPALHYCLESPFHLCFHPFFNLFFALCLRSLTLSVLSLRRFLRLFSQSVSVSLGLPPLSLSPWLVLRAPCWRKCPSFCLKSNYLMPGCSFYFFINVKLKSKGSCHCQLFWKHVPAFLHYIIFNRIWQIYSFVSI